MTSSTDPTAPIPLKRAQEIADAAVEAGLATAPASDANAYEFSPALGAKLAEVGADSFALKLDQAEVIEAFIAAERTP